MPRLARAERVGEWGTGLGSLLLSEMVSLHQLSTYTRVRRYRLVKGRFMSLPPFRRAWVTLSNLIGLGFLGIGFLQDYQLSHYSGGMKPPRSFLETFGRLVPVILLILGIVLEWLDMMWPALAVNVGSWGFVGFSVLGLFLWHVYASWPGDADPSGEGRLAIAIAGFPCTLVAIADFFLYWARRSTGTDA